MRGEVFERRGGLGGKVEEGCVFSVEGLEEERVKKGKENGRDGKG